MEDAGRDGRYLSMGAGGRAFACASDPPTPPYLKRFHRNLPFRHRPTGGGVRDKRTKTPPSPTHTKKCKGEMQRGNVTNTSRHPHSTRTFFLGGVPIPCHHPPPVPRTEGAEGVERRPVVLVDHSPTLFADDPHDFAVGRGESMMAGPWP